METKKLILLGGLAVIAVVAFLQLQKMGKPTPVAAPKTSAEPVIKTVSTVAYVDVLVASIDIPMGSRLTPDHMVWKKWPREALDANLIDNDLHPQAREEFTSSVVRATIYAGEPIMARKVVKSGDRSQMAALLEPGMRAISTRISVDSAANGFIQPGDRVDVVLTTQTRPSPQQQQNANSNETIYISHTIFENVKVLAIDQAYSSGSETGASIVGSTALLELSQADSEVLIEAQSKGELALTLRGLDRRRAAFVPSAATSPRKKAGNVSSMTIYRNGQPQRVAIQGQ